MSQSAALPERGYQAEDQNLTERVERALCASGYGALRTVEISVDDRVVRLEGPVSSYYLKQTGASSGFDGPWGP